MIKVLFKSEELLIAADSESKVVHLNNLTPKNGEEEVQRELDNGATPLEALKEWDII